MANYELSFDSVSLKSNNLTELFSGDFETGDVSKWSTVNNLSAVTDRVYEGSYAGYCGTVSTDYQAQYNYGQEIQPQKIEFYMQETNASWGSGVRLSDGSGNTEVGFASDNPEWDIIDGGGVSQVYGGDGYDRWIKVSATFDWNNNTFDVTFEDLQSGSTYSDTGCPLNNGNGVQFLNLQGYNGGTWQGGDAIDAWFDNILLSDYKKADVDVTVKEDSDKDGTAEATENVNLIDGVNYYRTNSDSFSNSGQVAVEFNISKANSKEFTSEIFSPVEIATPSVKDYNKYKELSVDSVSGSPSVSKVQPIYLISGDDSTTGNGKVVLDWSNISDKSDIAVFDQNDNLLDYEIEELDIGNQTGVIWAYNDWVRDGTIQAKITYGNGPKDRSVSGLGYNPWNNSQGSVISQRFNGNPNDSSPNNFNFTVTGASTAGAQFESGYSFDGSDDQIGSDLDINKYPNPTISSWVNTSNSNLQGIFTHRGGTNQGTIILRTDSGQVRVTINDSNGWQNYYSNGTIDDGSWHLITVDFSNDTDLDIYIDGSLDSSKTFNDLSNNDSSNIVWGNHPTESEYYSGLLDECKFFDRNISETWTQAEYDASAKAGQVFFSQESATLTDPPTFEDYNKYKDLTVDSVSGTPTVSKTQPIYLTSGDETTSGNGEIVLDWSNISDASDLGIFDQNDNLLDYEIEELDTTNNTGVIWAYNDWVRDGSVQGKVAYGNGPEDRSMAGTGANPWDNGQQALMVQHFEEDPLALNDSSPNKNDCTNSGAVSGQGQISNGVSFDGLDDFIDTPVNMNSDTSDLTVALWIYPEAKDKQNRIICSYNGGNAFSIRQDSDNTYRWATYDGSFQGITGAGAVDLSVWKNMVCRWDGTDLYELSFDGSTVASVTNSNFAINGLVEGIGDRASGQNQEDTDKWEGNMDALRFYDERKSDAWVTADYDASAKAGQIFFSQDAAQTTGGDRQVSLNSNSRSEV